MVLEEDKAFVEFLSFAKSNRMNGQSTHLWLKFLTFVTICHVINNKSSKHQFTAWCGSVLGSILQYVVNFKE